MLQMLSMDMPDHTVPPVVTKMSQMFPTIPHNIIWMYVQRYSDDLEKCAQMLKLQDAKYNELQSPTLDISKHMNNYSDVLQSPKLMLNSESILKNNNDILSTEQLHLLNDSNSNNEINCNDNQENEATSYDSHSSYSTSLLSPDTSNEKNFPFNFPTKPIAINNYNQPLTLEIVPDENDISHSWRPNITADMACSDIFAPSPMFDKFQLTNHQIFNRNSESNRHASYQNSSNLLNESQMYPSQESYGFAVQNRFNYGTDLTSYLHYQRSQMNAIQYEVIKAKIELSDLKDSVEHLECELKEKMQSKNVQDIVELNKEIEYLRLDCQSLCSEIDCNTEKPVLLGEVDEKYYEKGRSESSEVQSVTASQKSNIPQAASNNVLEESNRWSCPKCTFENHSAVSVCEMCQLPNPVSHRLPYMPSSYSPPGEKSLFVNS